VNLNPSCISSFDEGYKTEEGTWKTKGKKMSKGVKKQRNGTI